MSLTDVFFKPLLAPLQMTVDFFSPPSPAASAASAHDVLRPSRPIVVKSVAMPSAQITRRAVPTTPFRAPRVVHTAPVRSRRAQDGRMVISGTFRDVCAELDRLAT
jgi:hypothetical protein